MACINKDLESAKSKLGRRNKNNVLRSKWHATETLLILLFLIIYIGWFS